MRRAVDEAARCATTADVPVGAIVLDGDRIIGTGFNARERDQDPTAHAEVHALRAASVSRRSWRLDGCSLIVTLEPCAMCAGAASLARVARVVYGAADPKAGAAGSLFDLLRDRRLPHRPEVIGGVLEEECGALLRDFFGARRPR